MYDLKITNKETGRNIEMEIADLKALKEILKEFDETKIDFELHRKEKEKAIKIKMQVIDMLKKDLEKELNRTKLVLDYAREEIKTLKKDNLNLYNIICKNCGNIKTTDEEFKSLKKCNLIKEELEKIDDQKVRDNMANLEENILLQALKEIDNDLESFED